MTPPPDDSKRASRLGRTAGIATYGLIVAGLVALWSAQICVQVWGKPTLSALQSAPEMTCTAGTKKLVAAIETAQLEASKQESEADALRVFRQHLIEPWSARSALDAICKGDGNALQLLSEVDRLRYSEEHAVRYRATDLTKRRRDVARLLSARAQSPESALHQEANP